MLSTERIEVLYHVLDTTSLDDPNHKEALRWLKEVDAGSESNPIPYQQLIRRINELFGGQLPDDTPLNRLTNSLKPNKSMDPFIGRSYNRLWSRVISASNRKEKKMITGAFHALTHTNLETVGDLRDIPLAQAINFYRLGTNSLAFLKACVSPKPQGAAL